MAYVRSKTVKGGEYLYVQESYRQGGQVRTRHVRYVGGGKGRAAPSDVGASWGESSPRPLSPERQKEIDIITQNKRKMFAHLGEKKYEVKAYAKLAEKGLDTRNAYFDSEKNEYLPVRKKLHEQILASLDNPKANNAEGQQPTVIFLGGPPGSGKSEKIKKRLDTERFVQLDSDEIKKQLPEYNGLNANLVHEESSDIFNMATLRAAEKRQNILLDGTLKSTDKAKANMERFRALGYNVQLYATNVPTEVSVQRATDRAIKKGRYVPIEFIASNVEKINKSVRELAQFANEYQVFNTNVPSGADPEVILMGQNKF